MQPCRCDPHVRIPWRAAGATTQHPGCRHALEGMCPDHRSPPLAWHTILFISNWPFASAKEVFTCQSCKCCSESCSPALPRRRRWPGGWMREVSLDRGQGWSPSIALPTCTSAPGEVRAQGRGWISAASPVYYRSVRSQRNEAKPFWSKRP